VQLRGFLRIYARYLDLSPEEVLGRYSAEVHDSDAPPVVPPFPRQRPSLRSPLTT
jgi:cytoskeletal protein RodZ